MPPDGNTVSPMALSAFGPAAANLSCHVETCCALDCEDLSVIESNDLPMCARHVIAAWRQVKEFLDVHQAHFGSEPEPEQEPVRARPSRLLGLDFDIPGSHVYYLRFGDRIKIGVSSNLRSRLVVIPHDELLTVEVGDREVERGRHEQFELAHISGEWFRPTPELLEHIAVVKGRESQLAQGARLFLREYRGFPITVTHT